MTMAFSRSWILLSSFFLFTIAVNVSINSGTSTNGSSFQLPPPMELNPMDCRNYFHCQPRPFKDFFECVFNPRLKFIDSMLDCKGWKNKDFLQCRPLPTTTPKPTRDPDAPPPCNFYNCSAPDCFCDENSINIKAIPPVLLLPKDIPQMVILTFSGPINELNSEPISKLLKEAKKNPNGCPIKATFFVPHENTSYNYVQKLDSEGHEIATQTVTNRPQDFWPNATHDEWVEEVIGQKKMLQTLANVSGEDIVGMRVPFLESGDKNMLNMMYEFGLYYDSSVIRPPWLKVIPIWPYKVEVPSLLDKRFPGIWEFPINPYFGYIEEKLKNCTFLDECNIPNEFVFDFMKENFLRHYSINKPPFLMNFNTNSITDSNNYFFLMSFIHHVQETFSDIWFVTMQQAVEWLRKPIRAEQAKTFDAWKCSTRRMPECSKPLTCILKMLAKAESDTRYMEICGKCPKIYPSLNNLNGTKDGE